MSSQTCTTRLGKVLIKLEEGPPGCLLVHRDVVAAVPGLAPTLKETWACDKTVTMPDSQAAVNITVFSLQHVDDTYLLQRSAGHSETSEQAVVFTESIYCASEWPEHDASHSGYVRQASVVAHKALFAILYGYRPSLAAVNYCSLASSSCVERFTYDVHALVTICAYAEYYLCFEQVRPYVVELLLSQPLIWRSIAFDPEFYITLAKKLRSADMYFDALRHLIAQSASDTSKWDLVAAEFGISPEEARTAFTLDLQTLEALTKKLRDDLTRLELMTFTTYYMRQPEVVHTHYLNFLDFKKKRRSEYIEACEGAMFLARGVYG